MLLSVSNCEVTIASVYGDCMESFSGLLDLLKSNGNDAGTYFARLREELGRLQVWAGNSGAHRSGSVSLDYRLRDASKVKRKVIELLEGLQQDLDDAISIVSGDSHLSDSESVSTDSSQSSSGDEELPASEVQVRPVSGLEECFIDITHVITCLYEFSITIRNPAPRDRLEKCSSIPVSHFEDFDIQHASHKFPNTAERYLVERLGKANTRRRQLLKYHSKHHDKIAGTYNKLVLNPAQGLEAKKHDVEGQIKGVKAIDFDGHESAPIQVPETIKSATTTTMRSQTTVSTFVQRPDNFDAYSDTDNSQTSYASSSGEDSLYVPRLRVPPPPNQDCAFEGKPFQCPLCYLIISISEQNSWKGHVFRDLRPYVCTFKDCDKSDYLFESRTEWYKHEASFHRVEWFCNACVSGDHRYQSRSVFEEHLQKTHSDLFIPDQLQTIIDRCERPKSTAQTCPLCGENYSPDRLQRHLGGHMQQLSLFVLKQHALEQGEIDDFESVGAQADESDDESWGATGSERLEFESNPSRNSDTDSIGWVDEHMQKPGSLPEYTPETLRPFNGAYNTPIYVSLLGKVFDVSQDPHYKLGGLFMIFAGKDTSRRWVSSNCIGESLWKDHDKPLGLQDINDDGEKQTLKERAQHFESHYPLVGTLAYEENADNKHSFASTVPKRAEMQQEDFPKETPTLAADLSLGTPQEGRRVAIAIYDYEAREDNELTFPEGALIEDVEFSDNNWWFGTYQGNQGVFPANYVKLQASSSKPVPITTRISVGLSRPLMLTIEKATKLLKGLLKNAGSRLFDGLEGLRTVLQHVSESLQIDTFDRNSIFLAMLDTCEKDVGLICQGLQEEVLGSTGSDSWLFGDQKFEKTIENLRLWAEAFKFLLTTDNGALFSETTAMLETERHQINLHITKIEVATEVPKDLKRGLDGIGRVLRLIAQFDPGTDLDLITPHWAAEQGQEKVLQGWFRLGANINAPDAKGRTPLYFASGNGHVAAVQLLLARSDVDVNSKTVEGWIPIHVASFHGHEAVVQLLLARSDVDVNSKDKYGRTPLYLVSGVDHRAVVRLLLARSDVDVNSEDKNGRTPLYLASEIGYEAVVRLLLARSDIDVNSKDVNGRTSLFKASGCGHEAVVRRLLDRNDVDVNSKDKDGRTPLYYASENNHDAVVGLFLARSDVDVNWKDKYGWTPLYLASKSGYEAVVRLLLARSDVDVNSKIDTGETPLLIAVRRVNKSIVRLLLENGANVYAKNDSGKTALHFAIVRAALDMVRLLIQHGADVNARDRQGKTPLHFAVKISTNRTAIIEKLIMAGVDIYAQDYDRNQAIDPNDSDIAELLQRLKQAEGWAADS